MKYFNPYKSITGLCLLSLLIVTACTRMDTDEPEVGAAPSIERIRLTDTSTRNQSLTKATLGSTLVIVGKHLSTAYEVVFNGYAVPVNPTWTTETTLIVSIPDEVPTIATDPNVPNEIKVRNPAGEALFDFEVLPPPPLVERVSNEAAIAGSQITFYGRYFFFVDSVEFPGEKYVTSGFSTNTEGTALTLTVPAGVDLSAGTDIFVRSESGWSTANANTKLYNVAGRIGMLVDWDTRTSWNPNKSLNSGWGIDEQPQFVTSSYGSFKPGNGLYGVVDLVVGKNYGWVNGKLVAMSNNDAGINGGVLYPFTPASDYPVSGSISDYALKFEMASTKPLLELIVQVWQKNNGLDFSGNVLLSDYVKTTDGRWYTVTFPIKNMLAGGVGFGRYGDFANGNIELRTIVFNPTGTDIPATLAIDNIRVVKIPQ
jgi:hypothetical protein